MSAKNLRVLAGVLLAAGALLSCSGEADEPVSDPLAGTWQTSDVFMTFDSGEYTVAQGSATDTPFEGGTYEVDGTTVTLTPAPPTADIETTGLACSVGQVGVYEMTVSDDGSEIKLTVVSDDCADRRNDLSANSLKKTGGVAAGPPVPARNAAVFDFATDSLCTWFTADDMNEIVAAAQQRAGTDYDFKAFSSWSLPECRRLATMWKAEVASSPGLSVWFALEPLGDEPRWSPYVEPNPDEFVGHSLLDDEVTYQTRTYQFAWKAGVDGFLQVDGHQDEILYFGLAVHTGGAGTNEYEELGLAMVNETLERMNWIKVTE
ncbi:MAG: hypothetical protein MUE31_12375 [Candidatus Nanopelagicales bacterium]|nr:hypothetical protein [Candidatus Nanopelagicales bacterium]